jgi:hypothetical protein
LGLRGLAALRRVMLEALPLDDERDLEAQIEISFWGRALRTSKLRDLQHEEFERLWTRLRQLLAQAAELGELSEPIALDFATHQFVALIDGLSAQRVLYPDRVPADRQVAMLDRLLGSFSAAPSDRGPRATS